MEQLLATKTGLVLVLDSGAQSSWPLVNYLLAQGLEEASLHARPAGPAVLTDVTETLLCSDELPALQQLDAASSERLVVAPVQADLLDAVLVQRLEYLAVAVVTVSPHAELNSPTTALLEIVQRRPGGRLSRESLLHSISADGMAHDFRPVPAGAAAPPTPRPEPLPVSSFNLGTTAEQQASRAAVVLPYTRQAADAGPAAAAPRILAPDFDDEDPDDDLDI